MFSRDKFPYPKGCIFYNSNVKDDAAATENFNLDPSVSIMFTLTLPGVYVYNQHVYIPNVDPYGKMLHIFLPEKPVAIKS